MSEEGGMTATLRLGEHIDLSLEVGVGIHSSGLGHKLATADIISLHTTKQKSHVITCLAVVHTLLKHLDTGTGSLDGGLGITNNLYIITSFDRTCKS